MPATYDPIATQTLGSAAASVTFSSIPSTYTDLVLVFNGTSLAASYLSLQYNSDTGANYSVTLMRGDGTTASSNRYSNINDIYASIGNTLQTTISNIIFQIQNYSNSTTNKTSISRTNQSTNATETGVGLWRNTAAINAIKILSPNANFATGSVFTLYGIKAA
jgi:hypothetical protein